MNIRIGAELTQETVRCIYCKKPLNESATWYEQSLQVHMTCKNQIEEYQRNKGKLPEEVYKEFQEFFKKYNITQYRYATNEELYSLRTLNFNDKMIEYLPKSILHFDNLRELALAGNSIAELPEEIGSLIYLRLLNLSINSLKEVPSIIEQLPLLKQFMYAGNRLQDYPEEINKLNYLETLDLSKNEIEHIPISIVEMQTLEALYIQNNRLKKVPEELRKLRNLRTLHLADNQITTIPNWIDQKHFSLLNLTNNPIEDIEEKLRKLSALMLHGVVLQSYERKRKGTFFQNRKK